ncbi:hypothetical protein [Flavobacterium sp. S87F.05.LMB.W.Kidney.N]|uniref:hypothetical protein n=1 Tax=Flavobacterium sp. S87F.05.LMB.W.Kidney.N TaxID=1278758 RepID=UPI0010662876|nr:hypothetical protein [Flavobacterium sp. S87F.05.LMB.W.Kidney.N]TDX12195.1 hypothetical protein EDB96_1246 [Flavobacterium sp. S87F.05.LMB.W.Kidney.N]
MKKIILSLVLVLILVTGTYLFYDFKTKKAQKEYYKTLFIKDLDPESFITICKDRYNKTPINSVTMTGEFPENWVKPDDVQYLISIIRSQEKCCGYMNIFSSYLSTEDAEIGGFAIIFLNSYISKKKINLGLNCYPKTDRESIKKIEIWYKSSVHAN